MVRASGTPVGDVQLLNVHLRPGLAEGGRVSVSAYSRAKAVRWEEVRMLSAKLEPGAATIIAGDFNEGDGGRAVRWLEGRGFINALRRFDGRSHTWEWRTSVVTLRGRLDHILHSAGLACVDVQVLRRGASDHYPVVAVVGKREASSEE